MFEIQKSGVKTSSGVIGLDIRTHASPKVGQDPGVRRSKRPLLTCRTRLHMFYGNLAQLGKKSNSVIRYRSVMVKNWWNVLSMEGVTVCGHHPEISCSIREMGTSYCLVRSPYRPYNFLRDDFKCSLTYPCPRSLLESRIAPRIKHS